MVSLSRVLALDWPEFTAAADGACCRAQFDDGTTIVALLGVRPERDREDATEQTLVEAGQAAILRVLHVRPECYLYCTPVAVSSIESPNNQKKTGLGKSGCVHS